MIECVAVACTRITISMIMHINSARTAGQEWTTWRYKMYIKGFDKNLRCRGMQFEVGKEYSTGAADADIKLCTNTVFHFCDSLQKVNIYYSANPKENNRFCEIEVLGALVSNDEKCGSNRIRIIREILGDELDTMRGLINGNTDLFNSGSANSGSYNSGDFNSGRRNSGRCNSGSYNSGNFNSGSYNSGNFNSGNFNSGSYNSGRYNSGSRNSGDFNSGSYNSGDWNSGSNNFGFFCTNSPKLRLFNKETDFTMEEFMKTEWYAVLLLNSGKFNLTKWRYYTDEEKAQDERKRLIGGELITIPYKEACANWWASLSEVDKAIIKTIPNFDANIFAEITGIDLTNDLKGDEEE